MKKKTGSDTHRKTVKKSVFLSKRYVDSGLEYNRIGNCDVSDKQRSVQPKEFKDLELLQKLLDKTSD